MKQVMCVIAVFGVAMAAGLDGMAQEGLALFVGHWALVLPGNGPGWLGVEQKDGYIDGALLWYGGSVTPLASLYMDGDTLYATRLRTIERKDAAGAVQRTHTFTETFAFSVSGDTLKGTLTTPNPNGSGVRTEEFTGKRNPPLPAAPDLSAVQYGKPVKLFNGRSLKGWELTEPRALSGWSVRKDVLVNDPVQEEGKPHKHYGNLRTTKEFEDFKLSLEVKVPQGGNSGIYLRGIYEVQVADTYGKPLDPHNMGGIYSRIAPSVAAEKPAGEWQHFDITLLDRHVTVVLNGQTIVDNQPLLGCTGGALWSDEFRPGPIYLQGDHTGVEYRDIVLTPIVK